METFSKAFASFWQRHPSLLYGLTALLGSCAALNKNRWLWLPTLLILAITCLIPREKRVCIRFLLAMALGSSVFLYIKVNYQFPELPSEGVIGTAEVEIASLTSVKRHYGNTWVYRGVIHSFVPDNSPDSSIARQLPVTITLSNNDDIRRPPATTAYQIHGILKSALGSYSLSISKTDPWKPLKNTWSLAEWRYQLKKNMQDHLNSHIKNPQSASFLQGIATGDFDNTLLSFELGRFGLQHIMAISGFHFAIVAGCLSGILRLFLPKGISTCLLIVMIMGYLLFLGPSSSILRAWFTLFIALGGFLIQKRSFGLNSLGAALLLVILFDPLMSQNLGFQLSFITTAAILLLFSPFDLLLQRVFAKRSIGQVRVMNAINQHGYCLLSSVRQGLALTIAVNLVAAPVTLFNFHKFPLMSLVYNLFFPFLVSFSMLLLLLALSISPFIPHLANGLHSLNNTYTQILLNLTYDIPLTTDIVWRSNAFAAEWVILYLSGLFCLMIVFKYQLEKREEWTDLIFI